MSYLLAVTEVRQSSTLLIVALIAAVGAVAGPLLVLWRTERTREKREARDKKERLERDTRAEQTRKDERLADFDRTEAVRLMAAEAAVLLRKNTADFAEATRDTHQRLEVIHDLVNSAYTSALQGQRDSLLELVRWKDDEGRPVSDETRKTLKELEVVLAERRKLLAQEQDKPS